MKLSDGIESKIHVALGAASMCWDPLPHTQVFDGSRAKEIGKELCDELAASISNDACGDAIQKLWDEIIVARNPNYGDWEYPGQAYRHIKAEFEEVVKRFEAEKSNRIEYQDTVYAVCLELDRMLGNSPSRGQATGSSKEEVLDALRRAWLAGEEK